VKKGVSSLKPSQPAVYGDRHLSRPDPPRNALAGAGLLRLLLGLLILNLGLAALAGAQDDSALHPPRPGIFLIEAVYDTTGNFSCVPMPAVGAQCLTWDGGVLTFPEDLSPGRFGLADLTVPYGAELVGVSAGTRLVFREGRFVVDQPLLLTDGSVRLFVERGEIVIESNRIVVRAAAGGADDARPQYLLLAGIVLLIFVLMVRVRSRLRDR